MVLLFKTSVSDSVFSLAEIALTAKLFVPGWKLKEELERASVYTAQSQYKIGIAYLNENAVGVCLVNLVTNQIMAFVKKSHRKKGIGKLVVRETVSPTETTTLFSYKRGQGVVDSDMFWDRALTLNPENRFFDNMYKN